LAFCYYIIGWKYSVRCCPLVCTRIIALGNAEVVADGKMEAKDGACDSHAVRELLQAAEAVCVRSTTLCGNCCKALQKPFVCARCKTATYCSKDCQVHTCKGVG